MTMRLLAGRHPSSGEIGMWVARPGFDCVTGDRTSRAQFFLSTNFANQRALRIIKAGLIASNTPILLPGSLADLGGEPMLSYRVMLSATQERQNGYYGTQNDGAGNAFDASEFYNRLIGGSPAYFLIRNTASPNSQAFLLRYMIALF